MSGGRRRDGRGGRGGGAAINALKALRQADAAEDTTERAGAQPPSASALDADKAEDATEKQQWRTALLAARGACVPQPNAACQAAIAALQAFKGSGAEDLRKQLLDAPELSLDPMPQTPQQCQVEARIAQIKTMLERAASDQDRDKLQARQTAAFVIGQSNSHGEVGRIRLLIAGGIGRHVRHDAS